MKGTIQEVAAHLGTTPSKAYGEWKTSPEGGRIRKVKRGLYETPDVVQPLDESGGEAAPFDRFGFQLIIDVEVPAEFQAQLPAIAAQLLAAIPLPAAPAVERGRHFSMFRPRRGRTYTSASAGDQQEEA